MTATTEESTFFDPNVRTPEMEMAETGGVHAAADLDIADINRALATAKRPEVRRVLINLRAGSRNHLAAFTALS